jgi:hypothetical protein
MTLSLEGAAVDDGAVLLEIGPGVTGAAPGRADLEVHSVVVRDHLSVAIFGPLAGGPILRFNVEDKGSPPTVRLLEVAGEDGALRSSLGTYEPRIRLAR